ncbi:MAG: L-threonylcarbamoyladenylate synthase [Ignavibacteria bacterium]|jgi:L-threonylcarbamoyladenylate synthase
MKTLEATSENIHYAAELIKTGELVAFPTETVYGLGADGLNPIAVAKIFEAKNRPSFNPLILHVSTIDQLDNICIIDDDRIQNLITEFWPGPLTLVIPKKEIVPEIVTAGNKTVAVRMPNHPVALSLINKAKTPIAAPSANKFGMLSPTSAKHVEKQLKDRIKLILNGGESNIGLESTIIEINEKEINLLRPGGLPLEKIEEVIGEIKQKSSFNHVPNSPGQLPFHYSTNVPLQIINEKTFDTLKNKKVGLLVLKENKYEFDFSEVKVLSQKGDLREASANLFKYMHELDSLDLDLILVEPVNKTGLGKAVMDRLEKASNKFKQT